MLMSRMVTFSRNLAKTTVKMYLYGKDRPHWHKMTELNNFLRNNVMQVGSSMYNVACFLNCFGAF